jgi:hypothetical protein
VYSTESVETLYDWKKFELKTDRCGLQHIFTQSDLNARQRVGQNCLANMILRFTYIKGTMNRVAYAC